jgi:hypothetical protein
VTRYNDRNNEPKKTELVEWTYLIVEAPKASNTTDVSGDASTVRGGIESGLRSPLTARRRGKVEQYAVGFPRVDRPTKLLILSRDKSPHPLAGYEIYTHPPGIKTTVLVGRTLADGSISIPPAPEGVRVLLIKNGGEFLAKLPILPGMLDEQRAAVVDDDVRLEAEGFVTGVQQSFIDVLARTRVTSAFIRKRMDEGKFDEADKLFTELRGLTTRDQILALIANEESNARSTDRLIQSKINKMLANTRDVIERFIKPDEIDQLELEIRNRKASQPAPEPPAPEPPAPEPPANAPPAPESPAKGPPAKGPPANK